MPQLDDAAGVRTFYDDVGSGPAVVVLHGGLESGAAWDWFAEQLSSERRVLLPDRRGHGRTPDVGGAYTYEAMADETIAAAEQVIGGAPADFVGYSDGGVVALLVALRRPELVRSLVLIGTHFHRDGLHPVMADRLRHPDPDSPALSPLRDEYRSLSPDGPARWPAFHAKVTMMAVSGPSMTVSDLRRIDRPTFIIVGDDDVVDHHHTIEMFEALPSARLAIVPAASHLLPVERPEQLVWMIREFLEGDPPERTMPMRFRPPTVVGERPLRET